MAFFAVGRGVLAGLSGEGAFDGFLLPPDAGASGSSPHRLLAPEAAFGQSFPPVIRLAADGVDGAAAETLLKRGRELPEGALLVVAGERLLYPLRRLVGLLAAAELDWPLAVMVSPVKAGELPLGLAAEIGSLAGDGLLDALVCPDDQPEGPTAVFCRALLQAARLRTYRAEYISCPSCGRTLFDLQETTERIKARTSHLKGVKIGVMGCIVNGPGEMADADFGYVGGAPGKVNLFRGQECVERGVPTAAAVDRLVELIKKHGRWVEPPQ